MSEQRLIELILSLINQQISETDFLQLQNELEQNAQSRTLFVEYVSLHADLKLAYRYENNGEIDSDVADLKHWANQINDADSDLRRPPSLPATGVPVNASDSTYQTIAVWMPTAFSILLVGLGVWLFSAFDVSKSTGLRTMPESEKLTVGESESAKTAVAVVIKNISAQWGAKSSGFKQGESLSPGTLELLSGLVQIDFFCGASMILEGPADFEILDAKSGFVHTGKLRVFVPDRAKGFTIHSRQCEVIDLGTEFAMDVNADKDAEIHVLQGEVRIRNPRSSESEGQLLVEGKAVRFDGTERARAIEVSDQQFVGPEDIDRLARRAKDFGFENWNRGIEELKKDPSLLALYSFQESSEWDRVLVNSEFDANGVGDGAVVGCEWASGRWSSKRALQFKSPSDRVRVDVPAFHDSITLSCWLRIDSLDRDMAIMHPDTAQPEFMHWTLDTNANGSVGSLHLAVTDTINGQEAREHFNSGSLCLKSKDIGNWIHVAVTYDPVAKLVTHYKNGAVAGICNIKRKQRVGIGIANLGNWPYKTWAEGTVYEFRNLDGAMDEFIAFARVLDSGEIKEIFEFGNPDQVQDKVAIRELLSELQNGRRSITP